VVTSTLSNERVLLSGSLPARGSGPIADAVRLWKESDQADASRRDELMRLWIEAEVLRLTNARANQAAELGLPEPDSAVRKVQNAELNQRIYELGLRIAGARGLVEIEGGGRQTYLESDGAITWAFLRSRANTIEGGTSEMMRNLAAERVLGLPRDPR